MCDGCYITDVVPARILPVFTCAVCKEEARGLGHPNTKGRACDACFKPAKKPATAKAKADAKVDNLTEKMGKSTLG